MANLYLIDRPFGRNGLALAKEDEEAQVVLIQDGVYLNTSEVNAAGRKVYAVKQDVHKRGLMDRLADFVTVIDHDELVDLIVDHKVINFT
jgi:sulfur relay protein TusB/DsrH